MGFVTVCRCYKGLAKHFFKAEVWHIVSSKAFHFLIQEKKICMTTLRDVSFSSENLKKCAFNKN